MARARVEALLKAAARIADPADRLGRRAREELPASTGLSAENVELALTEILELRPSDTELDALLGSVIPAPRAHVVLAANVFVAAHRAIALALAQSPLVFVRPSRRDPVLAELLFEASDNLFELVDELRVEPGDHVWAYGTDESLGEIRRALPPGTSFDAHGPGLGVALVAPAASSLAARELARDVVPFDQRGCLSPRLAFVTGGEDAARAFAAELAAALEEQERVVPLGRLSPDELAEVTRWRETMRFAGELLPASSGWVSLPAPNAALVVPPVGRNVTVVSAPDWESRVSALQPLIAAVGVAGPPELEARAARALPRARRSAVGRMQRPRFDGPVDLRARTERCVG